MHNDRHGWADCFDGFMWVVKQRDLIHIVTVGANIGPAHSVQENAASERIVSIWLVNNHIDLDTYQNVY